MNHAPSPSNFTAEPLPTRGGIDCDVHPPAPETDALMPYLDDFWRQSFEMRGFNRLNLAMTASPPNAPINKRPDWVGRDGEAPIDTVRRAVFDELGASLAICNPLHGAQILHSDDMGAVLCRAVNDWLAEHWLDRDSRLRGSIVISAQNAELAVEEIERRAADTRFVQILLLSMNDEPLGRRRYWPIYEAAQRHDLPVAIHAGGSYRHAPTATGWPSHVIEDYIAQAAIAESQLLSLVAEGVFARFEAIRFVFAETGFMWVPSFFWRADKTWRGTRAETPWIKQPPSELVKRHVRFTIQPADALEASQIERTLVHLDCDDLLLYASDFPHWHFDGQAALPAAFGAELGRKILRDNPLATYPRLREALAKEQTA
ncbi:amidohydrolase family protein [Mesorhizobium sp. CAU 1741]|uniref:amidohydrolase family protein n=1 Tax=Mesorhizobium sp. CAU 1741 TaxID=3140366 RepID=UPI00325A955B